VSRLLDGVLERQELIGFDLHGDAGDAVETAIGRACAPLL
jgi:hypothetical protein